MVSFRERLHRLWANRPAAGRRTGTEPPAVADGSPMAASEPAQTGHEEPGAPSPTPAWPPVDSLNNRPWIKLAEDCVALYDELDHHLTALDAGGRDLAEHVCLRLQEILQRNDVTIIDEDGGFERTLHQPTGGSAGGGSEPRQVTILSPGFRVGRRILRRARVQLNPPQTPTP